MKKLKLTKLANNEITKQQLDEIKGGYESLQAHDPIYLFKCSCRRFTTPRTVNSRSNH